MVASLRTLQIGSRAMSRVVLLLAIVVLIVGCGGGDRSGGLVTAAGVVISKSQVNAWLGAFYPWGASDGNQSALATCINARRCGDGQRKAPSDVDGVERKCSAELRFWKSEVMAFLVRSVWLKREAARRSVSLTADEMRGALEARMESFSGGREFDRYLADSGMSRRQFRARVKRDALFRKLMLAVIAPDLTVSKSDVERRYRRSASEFRLPTTRDLRAVVTGTRERADYAMSALRAGRPWGSVVRKFSADASRRSHGRMSIDTHNVIYRLRSAVFSAQIGQIVGPLEIRGAWWVFRVDRHHPARQLSLAEATPRIRTSIRSTREQLAIDQLGGYLERRYQRLTVCHNGYVASVCRNRQAGKAAVPRSH